MIKSIINELFASSKDMREYLTGIADTLPPENFFMTIMGAPITKQRKIEIVDALSQAYEEYAEFEEKV